jgi:hypothetical protein
MLSRRATARVSRSLRWLVGRLAARAVIVKSSLGMVRTPMIRIVGAQALAILPPTVRSSVRISVCPVIGGPTGRIEFVGADPAALASVALAAVLRDGGGGPPPAVHSREGCLPWSGTWRQQAMCRVLCTDKTSIPLDMACGEGSVLRCSPSMDPRAEKGLLL